MLYHSHCCQRQHARQRMIEFRKADLSAKRAHLRSMPIAVLDYRLLDHTCRPLPLEAGSPVALLSPSVQHAVTLQDFVHVGTTWRTQDPACSLLVSSEAKAWIPRVMSY